MSLVLLTSKAYFEHISASSLLSCVVFQLTSPDVILTTTQDHFVTGPNLAMSTRERGYEQNMTLRLMEQVLVETILMEVSARLWHC